MIKNHRLLIFVKVLIVTAAVSLICYIFIFHPRPRLDSVMETTNKIPDVFSVKEQSLLEGFELSEFKKGKRIFILKAKQLCLRNRKVEPFGFRIALGKTAQLQDVDMTFYLNGEPVSCLHSNTALLNRKSKNVVFQGKPAILTKDHKVLSARELKWDNNSQSIQARGNCILVQDGMNQYAEAMAADIDLNEVIIIARENKTDFEM